MHHVAGWQQCGLWDPCSGNWHFRCRGERNGIEGLDDTRNCTRAWSVLFTSKKPASVFCKTRFLFPLKLVSLFRGFGFAWGDPVYGCHFGSSFGWCVDRCSTSFSVLCIAMDWLVWDPNLALFTDLQLFHWHDLEDDFLLQFWTYEFCWCTGVCCQTV